MRVNKNDTSAGKVPDDGCESDIGSDRATRESPETSGKVEDAHVRKAQRTSESSGTSSSAAGETASATAASAEQAHLVQKRLLHTCEVCNGRVFQGAEQFSIHLHSRGHKNALKSRAKKEALKVFLADRDRTSKGEPPVAPASARSEDEP